jgi:hypothetical protein
VPAQRFWLTIRLNGCRRSISAEAESAEFRRKILAIGVIVSSDREVLRYDDGMDVILTIYEADEMGLGRSFPPAPRRGRKDFDVELPRVAFAELWRANAAVDGADLHIRGERDESRTYWIESIELVEGTVAGPILTELRDMCFTELRDMRERVRSIEAMLAILLVAAGAVFIAWLIGRIENYLTHPW